MTTPLWDKGASVDERAMAYMAGDDVILDRELLPFDIRATRAHVRGLATIGALDANETDRLVEALDQLDSAFASGDFVLDRRFEDGHSAIEWFLTESLGDAGRRVHLGRSRNDQVAVALRLYMKHALESFGNLLCKSAQTAADVARTHADAPMPGYTHLQRAVPSSVGLWMGSFAESFADIAGLCAATRDWISTSPLGTAAGYGVNLPLERDAVAHELGFDRIQVNPMAAQASRGRLEFQTLTVLWQGTQELRRLSWDLTLFSSAEFGFVTLGDAYRTGSSIMPNKANPDMTELLRGACAAVGGAMTEIQQLLALPSGYHRDLQLTKPPLIRGCRAAIDGLSFIPDLLRTLELHTDRMRDAIDPSMLATDRAVDLARDGMPFREAYRKVADDLKAGLFNGSDPAESLRSRVSPGGCADLRLEDIEKQIESARCALASDPSDHPLTQPVASG